MSGDNGKVQTPKQECRDGGMVRVRRVRGPAVGFHREMGCEVVIGGVYEVTPEMAARMCAEGGEFEVAGDETLS